MTDDPTATATQDHPADPTAILPTPLSTTPADLAAVRELALAAHPGTVPELVAGATIGEIITSLEPARAAYRRIADAAAQTHPPAPVPTVPAGAAQPVALDSDSLPPAEKIRRALADRDRRTG